MTTTAAMQVIARCQWASCLTTASHHDDQWSFCTSHYLEHQDLTTEPGGVIHLAGPHTKDRDPRPNYALTRLQLLEAVEIERDRPIPPAPGDLMTTTADPTVKAVRLLRDGNSVRQVADELQLSEDRVRELVRDIPGLRPQSDVVHIAMPVPSPTGLLLEQASGHSNAAIRRLGQQIEQRLDTLRTRIAEQAEAEQQRQVEAAARAKAVAEVERLTAQLRAAKAALKGKAAPTATTPRKGPQWSPEQRAAAAERLRACNLEQAQAKAAAQAAGS